jgi:hypothetical protein
MATKKTQIEILREILALNLTDEQKEMLENEIAKREKKKASNSEKVSKEQETAKAEALAIYKDMEADKWYTIPELMKLSEIDSCQKVTNRMIILMTDNLAENSKIKGKSVYRKIAVATEEEGEG